MASTPTRHAPGRPIPEAMADMGKDSDLFSAVGDDYVVETSFNALGHLIGRSCF